MEQYFIYGTNELEYLKILSYGDLAILRGMRIVYHHRNITPELFNKINISDVYRLIAQ